ncbi:hypothetical protein TNCV_4863371 [Trichonephila clavipes]|nr:hypothetical protein TNCV_4863371 [Trichonephila clavipes]
MPTLPERALLAKLYYRNSENAMAAIRVPSSRETTTWTDAGACFLKHDGKIRENRTVRRSSWKRTKNSQHSRRIGYRYSDYRSKQ